MNHDEPAALSLDFFPFSSFPFRPLSPAFPFFPFFAYFGIFLFSEPIRGRPSIPIAGSHWVSICN